jgi:hypothetical protein
MMSKSEGRPKVTFSYITTVTKIVKFIKGFEILGQNIARIMARKRIHLNCSFKWKHNLD